MTDHSLSFAKALGFVGFGRFLCNTGLTCRDLCYGFYQFYVLILEVQSTSLYSARSSCVQAPACWSDSSPGVYNISWSSLRFLLVVRKFVYCGCPDEVSKREVDVFYHFQDTTITRARQGQVASGLSAFTIFRSVFAYKQHSSLVLGSCLGRSLCSEFSRTPLPQANAPHQKDGCTLSQRWLSKTRPASHLQ